MALNTLAPEWPLVKAWSDHCSVSSFVKQFDKLRKELGKMVSRGLALMSTWQIWAALVLRLKTSERRFLWETCHSWILLMGIRHSMSKPSLNKIALSLTHSQPQTESQKTNLSLEHNKPLSLNLPQEISRISNEVTTT